MEEFTYICIVKYIGRKAPHCRVYSWIWWPWEHTASWSHCQGSWAKRWWVHGC